MCTRRAALLPLALLPALPCVAVSCRRGDGAPEPLFVDVTRASGIDFRLESGARGERRLPETTLGGLGWLDFDGDGDYDLYLVNGHSDSGRAGLAGKEGDKLYRNDGGGRFSDITEAAGVGDRRYGMGIAVGDYDNDGHSDFLVTNFGRNTLYHNDGGGTFTDVTEEAGLVEVGFSTSAAWFDMDRDGDLDLYVVRYLRYDPQLSPRMKEDGRVVYLHPKHFQGEPDLLYRNLGGGRFEEVGREAGIARAGETEGKGLGIVCFDWDRDGLTDVYVANDTTPNFLWRANGDGTFTDHGYESGAALSATGKPEAGMGVDVADVDGNGLSDLHVTNFSMEANALYLAQGDGRFRESSRAAGLGVSYVPLGFGTLFLDVDLDGGPDLVVLNGHVNDLVEETDPGSGMTYRQRPMLWRNDGRGAFEVISAAACGPFFASESVGRGLAGADFDNDGDTDLAAMTLDRSLVLLERRSAAASLVVKLEGTRSNRDGYGARIVAEAGGRVETFEYQSARSYLSACDPRPVIGLGSALRLDRLTIHWPSGARQTLEAVEPPPGRVLVIREPDGER